MSSLRPGDEQLHHRDGSHAWDGGPADKGGQEAWQAELRAHVDAHRAGADLAARRARRARSVGDVVL